MQKNLRTTKMALVMEMVPLIVQLLGIVALLYLAYPDALFSLASIIICFIWLKLSKNEMPDEFGRLRMQRRLFAKLGDWLDQSAATDEYDKAQEDILLIEGSLEDDQYCELISAAGIANMVRSTVSILLSIYMLYSVVTIFISI